MVSKQIVSILLKRAKNVLLNYLNRKLMLSSDCKTDARQYSTETLIEKHFRNSGDQRVHYVEELNIFNAVNAFRRGSSLKDVGFKDDSQRRVLQK